MINPSELRKLADESKEKEGKVFVLEIVPKIESEMKLEALRGKYELTINQHNALNENGWLSEPHLYNPVIKKLEESGFKVSHSDCLHDGTYLCIKW